MRRQGLNSFLMSGTLAAMLAAGSAGSLSAELLADALVKAYQTSPLLESSRAALRSLDELVPQARADKRPQVGASVNASSGIEVEDIEEKVSSIQAALSASLLVYDHGQTRAAVESARHSIASGRADLTDIEQQVLFNAVQAYVDVRRDQEFVRLARNDVDRLIETLEATQNRFDVGEVTRTDVSQSQSRLAASRSTLEASLGALEVSRQLYKQAVGNLPENLEPLPPLPRGAGLARRGDRAGDPAQPADHLGAVRRARRRLRLRSRPRRQGAVGLGDRLGRCAARQPAELVWDGATFSQVGIEGSMPLYTGGRNDSLVRQAQAVLDQRRFEVQDEARAVTQEVAQAWSELEVAQASIVARREQVEAARIAAEGVAEEARLGARSTLDVLDADQERLQAEAEVVQALRDEYVATYSVLQAIGLLTVAHLQLGIETYDPEVNFQRVRGGPPGGYDTSAVDRIRARWQD